MLAASGGAARFVVVENADPLDATGSSSFSTTCPRSHGPPGCGARFELAGQTALTGDSIGSVFADLGRVALVRLALFLRSLLAPVYLLAASVLVVFAT